MNKIANKLIAVVTLISTLFFQSPGFALAYYQDSETGKGYLETGLLDFELSETGGFAELTTLTQPSTTTISVVDKSTIPFKYRMTIKNIKGSTINVCDYIWFTIKQGNTVLYKDISLSTLTSPIDLGIYDKNNASFSIEGKLSSDDKIFQDQNCAFDVEFEGVQTNHDYHQGYYDIETASEIVYTGHFKDDLKCDKSVWNPGSIRVVATNSYSADCRIEHVEFNVTCTSGNNVNCGSVGMMYSNAMGVNAMHQITPDFPEGMTTMFDASAPLTGQGVIWLTRPLPATGKTYSVNVQHEFANYESAYGAYITYGDTCEGVSKMEKVKMAGSFAPCQGGTETTDITFIEPTSTTANAKGSVVMNEALPYPNGNMYGTDWGHDSDSYPKGEWIELYNNSSTSTFDLSGLYFQDTSGNKIYINSSNSFVKGSATTTIGKKGTGAEWMVVYMDYALMDNEGDTITFTDTLGNAIDTLSYTLPQDCNNLEMTPGDPNYEKCVGNAPKLQVVDNKSIARIPDGIGEWVDPIPTPGNKNIDDIVVNPIANATNTDSGIINTLLPETSTTTATTTIPEGSLPTISPEPENTTTVATTTFGFATTTLNVATTTEPTIGTTTTPLIQDPAPLAEPPTTPPDQPIIIPTTLPDPIPEPQPLVIQQPQTPTPQINTTIIGVDTSTSGSGTNLIISP
jgi:hypothetical protein